MSHANFDDRALVKLLLRCVVITELLRSYVSRRVPPKPHAGPDKPRNLWAMLQVWRLLRVFTACRLVQSLSAMLENVSAMASFITQIRNTFVDKKRY